jgi:transcriptional regulator with XRE-family HTH domain
VPRPTCPASAVAEHLSFRAAAERLELTAPAVSHSIRQLEARLGVRLLNRWRALGSSVSDLASAAVVSPPTVRRFERGGSMRPSTVKTIQRALEKAGGIFIDANDGAPGTRLGKG